MIVSSVWSLGAFIIRRLDKQLSRFPHDDKFDFRGKLRWTFGGKSGYEAILKEMRDWKLDLSGVVEAIKFLQSPEKREEQVLFRKLFEIGGSGVRQADVMDRVLSERMGQSPYLV
jgi:hypothetical protein